MAQQTRPALPPNAKPSTATEFFRQNLEDELFEKELTALKELKTHDISSKFEDRFMVGCLLSRKLDIKRTVKMLEANYEWRKEHGYEHIPDWYKLNKPLMQSDFAVTINGARSKAGCGIIYTKFGNMVPGDHPNFLKDILDYIVWNNMVGIFLEDIEYHRNGVCFIADLRSTGWKNFDMKLQKTVNAALMDKFPLKISQVLILNPPGIFKPLYAGCKLFIKKKIMDRIQIVESEDIFNYIDKDQLFSDFGGNIQYSIDTYLDWVDHVLPTLNSQNSIHSQNSPRTQNSNNSQNSQNSTGPIKVPYKPRKTGANVPQIRVSLEELQKEGQKEGKEGGGAKSARAKEETDARDEKPAKLRRFSHN